jgi:hypothetical protein
VHAAGVQVRCAVLSQDVLSQCAVLCAGCSSLARPHFRIASTQQQLGSAASLHDWAPADADATGLLLHTAAVRWA